MDFPGELSNALGVSEAAARGLAGQVVGLIEDEVREAVSFGLASKIRDAVPEVHHWQASTPTLPPGAISREESFGRPVVGEPPEEAELRSMLKRFRVPVERSPEVRALALQFLSSRLDAQTVATIVRAVPYLTR
jgi:hypothetical protein